MKYVYLLFILILIVNCSESTQPSKSNHFSLPNEFPLKVGKAWVFERHYYENHTDTMFLDTLFIYGMYNEYYKYSWDPSSYTSLVKNENNKLLNFGSIRKYNSIPDTFLYEKPHIWAFFNTDTGFIETSDYSDYFIFGDSTHSSIQYNKEQFGKKFDTYILKWFYEFHSEKIYQYTNVLGFVHWMNYDDSTEYLKSETKLISILENFYPSVDTSMKKYSPQYMNNNNNIFKPDGLIRNK